jgi:hypothetical protein
MAMYYELVLYRDCEGEWTRGDVQHYLYPSADVAWAAWEAHYRGPDPFGAECRAEVAAVQVGEAEQADLEAGFSVTCLSRRGYRSFLLARHPGDVPMIIE